MTFMCVIAQSGYPSSYNTLHHAVWVHKETDMRTELVILALIAVIAISLTDFNSQNETNENTKSSITKERIERAKHGFHKGNLSAEVVFVKEVNKS